MRYKIVAKHKRRDITFETGSMLELIQFASERHMKLSSFDIDIFVQPDRAVQYIDLSFKVEY